MFAPTGVKNHVTPCWWNTGLESAPSGGCPVKRAVGERLDAPVTRYDIVPPYREGQAPPTDGVTMAGDTDCRVASPLAMTVEACGLVLLYVIMSL